MMEAMVTGPPQRALLDAQRSQQRHDRLKGPGGLERAMREISVIEARNKEDAHPIEPQAGHQCRPTHPHQKRREHAQVQRDEAPVVPNCLPGGVALLDSRRQLDLFDFQAIRRRLKA